LILDNAERLLCIVAFMEALPQPSQSGTSDQKRDYQIDKGVNDDAEPQAGGFAVKPGCEEKIADSGQVLTGRVAGSKNDGGADDRKCAQG